MELKVWVEGIQRIVCGVTDATTCQDVVYALAHATGKTGRFTLIERWRSSERLLAPNQHPLKVLLKWGEHASDVQFILQRTSLETQAAAKNNSSKPHTPTEMRANTQVSYESNNEFSPLNERAAQRPLSPNTNSSRDIKKSLTFSGGALGADEAGGMASRRYNQVGEECNGALSPQYASTNHTRQQFDFNNSVANNFINVPNNHSYSPKEASFNGNYNERSMRSHHSPQQQIYSPDSTRSSPHISSPLQSSFTRPAAPPPYEVVRGNPPHPSLTNGHARNHMTYNNMNDGVNRSQVGYHSNNSSFDAHQNSVSPALNTSCPSAFSEVKAGSHRSTGSLRHPPRMLPPYRPPPPPPNASQRLGSPLTLSPSKRNQFYDSSNNNSPKQHLTNYHSSESNLKANKNFSNNSQHSLGKSSKLHSGSNSKSDSLLLRSSDSQNPVSQSLESQGRSCNSSPMKERSLESPNNVFKVPFSESPVFVSSHGSSDLIATSASELMHQNLRVRQLNSPSQQVENNSVIIQPPAITQTTRSNIAVTSPVTSIVPNQQFGGHQNQPVDKNHYIDQTTHSPVYDIDNKVSYDTIAAVNGHHVENNHTSHSQQQAWMRKSEERNSPSVSSSQPSEMKSPAVAMGRQVEHVVLDGIHRDLVNLVNLQRDKLTNQQVQLTQFEAEITYLENRWREDQAKLRYANTEMERLTQRIKQIDCEVTEEEVAKCESELRAALSSEKQVKEELLNLQQKMQNCDSTILQLRDNIRHLELEMEQAEEPVIDGQIEEEESPELTKQLSEVESALISKREQMEELKRAMMTENLEALSLTPQERRPANATTGTSPGNEPGSGRTSTNRRMVGSPRMLETAVPTSKNPHGVWV